MSKFNTRTLTKKGSVTFHGTEGIVHYDRGDKVKSASDWKAIPNRQQKFFEKQEVKSKKSGDNEPSLGKQIDDDLTVDQLQERLNEAEVEFTSDARKDDLIALYVEHVATEEEA